MDVGQAEVATAVAVGQTFVVQPEEVQDGRVQVVDVHLVFRGVVAVVVGGSVAEPALYAAAGHPHGEAFRVVVSPIAILGSGRAAEFSSPDYKRVVQHAARFQVLQQTGHRLVDLSTIALETKLHVAVLIPLLLRHPILTVRHLDEPHSPLGKSPRQQALHPEVAALLFVDAVKRLRRSGLPGGVQHLGTFALHPKRQLEGMDSPLECGVRPGFVELLLVQLAQQIQLERLLIAVESGVFCETKLRVFHWRVGIARRAKRDAVVRRRQKRRAVVVHPAVQAGRTDGHKPG